MANNTHFYSYEELYPYCDPEEMIRKLLKDDFDEIFEDPNSFVYKPHGKRKTGSAYRRKMARQKFEKKKKIGTYIYHACWVDWDEVDGKWMPVGKYIKYPSDSEARSYFKRYSNRKVRRMKYDDIPTKGNGYRRQFDYWWTLY